MLEKGLLVIVALVGGYASLTGTLPSAMVALFGNPAVLKTTGNDDSLLLAVGLSPAADLFEIGSTIDRFAKDLGL
jgi:hypothetical protein